MRVVTELVADRADASDPVIVIDDRGSHRARELLEQATAIAGTLAASCPARPTVLVEAENTWRTIAVALAVGKAGGTLSLVGNHARGADVAAAFEDVRPDAVISGPGGTALWDLPALVPGGRVVASALDGWPVLVTDIDTPGRFGAGAVIGLTSGSTGRPKGVVQSEASLRYATSCTIEAVGLRPGEPVAAVVPLSSTAAFCFGAYLALSLGGPLVLSGDWDPPKALRRLEESGARWLMCVPTMALTLASLAGDRAPLRAMRALTVGGGPMDAAILARAEATLGVPILRVFGMSECLGATTPSPRDPAEIRLGKDGLPFPGTLIRAAGPDGAVLAAGQAGLAQVSGPSLFLGYARNGSAAAPELTADGFFETGDLVRVGADGFVEVVGREKDVIIRGGLNIGVIEIENAIGRDPRVAQVCVVPVPDSRLGERIAALVVPAGGQEPDLASIVRFVAAEGLAKNRWPEFLYLVDEIPHTAVGKLARQPARQLAGKLHANGAGASE